MINRFQIQKQITPSHPADTFAFKRLSITKFPREESWSNLRKNLPIIDQYTEINDPFHI